MAFDSLATYLIRSANGAGACVCNDCSCSYIRQEVAELGKGKRVGYNGWDDDACKIYRTLTASASLNDGSTPTRTDNGGDSPCVYTETVTGSSGGSFTVGDDGGTGTYPIAVTGGGSASASGSGTRYDADFLGCVDNGSPSKDFDVDCSDGSCDGAASQSSTWGCNAVQPELYDPNGFNFSYQLTDVFVGASFQLLSCGLVVAAGTGAGTSLTYTGTGMCSGGTGAVTITGSVDFTCTITLTLEWPLEELLTAVTDAGSEFSGTEGTTLSAGLSGDGTEAFYQELRYRFLKPTVASSVAFEVVVRRFRYGGGIGLGVEISPGVPFEEISRTPQTVTLPARNPAVMGEQFTDWVELTQDMPDAGYQVEVTLENIDFACTAADDPETP